MKQKSLDEKKADLAGQIEIMWAYLIGVLIPNKDLHGIMDWSADVREMQAKLDILEEG